MRGILVLSQGRDIVLLALVPQSHDLVHSYSIPERCLSSISWKARLCQDRQICEDGNHGNSGQGSGALVESGRKRIPLGESKPCSDEFQSMVASVHLDYEYECTQSYHAAEAQTYPNMHRQFFASATADIQQRC